MVLPVFVRRPELTRELARNDVVRLHYEIRSRPDRPVHLELADAAQPVEVVDSITALHGRAADLEGALVLFPQSPQVRFNVFAVLEPLVGGAQRQFTLVNFDDAAKFTAIRAKLQAAWDGAGPDAAVSGRNKLISTKVRVRVKGIYNQIDPNQANAQIVLDGPEAIEIVAPRQSRGSRAYQFLQSWFYPARAPSSGSTASPAVRASVPAPRRRLGGRVAAEASCTAMAHFLHANCPHPIEG